MTVRPALVWVRNADPRLGGSGAAVCSLEFARILADHFDLHLVCHGDRDGVERDSDELFRSVRIVLPDHARSAASRIAWGIRYGLRQVLGLEPLASSVESDGAMQRAVSGAIVAEGAGMVLAEHWPLGRLLREVDAVGVIRLIDVEHENLAEVASRTSLLLRPWIRWRRAAVRRAEIRAVRGADVALAVSDEDAAAFAGLGVEVTPLPVTTPTRPTARRPRDGRVLFLGRLDWWPNVDGLDWFVELVWPLVLRSVPEASLRIIGGGAAPEAGRRWNERHVEVVGWVDDLDDEFASAAVAVVPVRVGTGVKIKTLELMAAGVPVVSTRTGSRGTPGANGGAVIADDPELFARSVVRMLDDPDHAARQARVAVQMVGLHHDRRPTDDVAERLTEMVSGGD